MIYLITAVPGSGKTLFAVDYFLKSGNFNNRPIYSNINGLTWPNVLEAPDDWRDTPVGSLIIYDEAQSTNLFPATGRPGRSNDERITALETHRHTGHDIVFITQAPTQIHHQIRNLCGKHIHLYRAARLQKAMVYEHDSVMDLRNLGKYPSRLWSFPQDLYNSYTSTVQDTHSGFKLPGRVIFIFGFILVAIVFTAYTGYRAFLGFSTVSAISDIADNNTKSNPSSSSTDSNPPNAILQPVVWHSVNPVPHVIDVPPDLSRAVESLPPPTGCIASKSSCRCYGSSGVELMIPEPVCRSEIAKVMPVRVRSGSDSHESESKNGQIDIGKRVKSEAARLYPDHVPTQPVSPPVPAPSQSVSMGYGYPPVNPGGLGFSE